MNDTEYVTCDCGARVHPDEVYTYATFAASDADRRMACHNCILEMPDGVQDA